jgi:hypothetical protein
VSARVGRPDATATEQGRADRTEPVVIGLLAAPGLTEGLARRLVRDLPALLHERLPRFAWLFVMLTEVRAGPAGFDVDLVRVARERCLGRWPCVCTAIAPWSAPRPSR